MTEYTDAQIEAFAADNEIENAMVEIIAEGENNFPTQSASDSIANLIIVNDRLRELGAPSDPALLQGVFWRVRGVVADAEQARDKIDFLAGHIREIRIMQNGTGIVPLYNMAHTINDADIDELLKEQTIKNCLFAFKKSGIDGSFDSSIRKELHIHLVDLGIFKDDEVLNGITNRLVAAYFNADAKASDEAVEIGG